MRFASAAAIQHRVWQWSRASPTGRAISADRIGRRSVLKRKAPRGEAAPANAQLWAWTSVIIFFGTHVYQGRSMLTHLVEYCVHFGRTTYNSVGTRVSFSSGAGSGTCSPGSRMLSCLAQNGSMPRIQGQGQFIGSFTLGPLLRESRCSSGCSRGRKGGKSFLVDLICIPLCRPRSLRLLVSSPHGV